MKTGRRKKIQLLIILLIFSILAVLVFRMVIKSPENEPEKISSLTHEKPGSKTLYKTKPEIKLKLKPKKIASLTREKPGSKTLYKTKPEIKQNLKLKKIASLSISPDKEMYISTPESGSFTIKVKSTTAWKVNSNKDWLKLNRLRGHKSDKAVKATYTANTGTDERSAVITFIPKGTDEKTILVIQKGVTATIPEVSTGRAVSVNDNIIVVSGTINNFGAGYDSVSQHGHCWSETNTEPTIDDKTTELDEISVTGSFVSKMTDLEPLRKYYVRAYAINDTGTAYGTTVELSTQISAGLVAYYPFDGNAKDQSGYGLHGTIKGGVKSAGDRYDNLYSAYNFNGTDGYITIGDYLDNTSTLTFSFWVYLNTPVTVPIIARYDTGTDLRAYYIDCSENKAGIGVRDNVKTLSARTSNISIPDKKWVHITAVFDLTQEKIQDRLKIYCDGISQDLTYSSSSDIKKIPDISVPLNIGRYTLSRRSSLNMKGMLDEICIYSRVLSEKEINCIYNRKTDTPLINPGVAEVASGKTSGLTNKTARITGNLNSFGRNYSEVLEHGYCWSATTSMPTVTNSAKTELGKTDKTGEFLSVINGLQPVTKYYFRAYATNETGTTYGEVEEFTTLQNPYISVATPAEWSIDTNPDILWITHLGKNIINELYPVNLFYETLAVRVSGNFAYVAENKTSGLRILNLSVLSRPLSSSFLNLSGTMVSIELSGSFVYLLSFEPVSERQPPDNNKYKLHKIDVSNPLNPFIADTYIIADASEVRHTGLQIIEKMAYVTLSPYLYLIDISGAPLPSYTKYQCSSDGAHDAYIEGDYAYVADGTTGLRIINISDKKNPKTTAICNTPGPALDVFISKSYAFVSIRPSSLVIIDTADPQRPLLSAIIQTAGAAENVFVSGNYAYVASGDSGLQIIDISDPHTPRIAGEYNTPGHAYEALASGLYAYIADGTGGLQVIHLGPFFQGARSYYNYNIPFVPARRQ